MAQMSCKLGGLKRYITCTQFVEPDFVNVSGTITGITKSGKLVASGYRPAMNYVYNDFMVQVTLAGGNSQVPVNTAFTLPNEMFKVMFIAGAGISLGNVNAVLTGTCELPPANVT